MANVKLSAITKNSTEIRRVMLLLLLMMIEWTSV